MDVPTGCKESLVALSLVLATASAGCAIEDADDHIGELEQSATFRCATPVVHFKQNPQPGDCQNSTLSNPNRFNFFFDAGDVADQDIPVYFYSADNSQFLTVELTLADAVSFHTEWNATAITRAYYKNAAGATQEVSVPAIMVGVHHGSSNNSSPSATWSSSQGNQTQAVSFAPQHTCTYLRTR